MKQTFDNFKRILNRSKEYEFESHTVLVLRDYYSGDEVRLDLSLLTEEMFNEIKMGSPVEDVWDICKGRILYFEEQVQNALMVMDMDRCMFEYADNELYNNIERAIEDYCIEHDLDRADVELEPEDVLVFNPDAQ